MNVAIILARGGSKGIPKKNIMDFCGKPLIQWTIEQCKESLVVDVVYVSTDSYEIASVSSSAGAEIIKRPDDISGDTATSESALIHAYNHIVSLGINPNSIVFPQVTSPVREASDIKSAMIQFNESSADSLFSAAKLDDFCVWNDTTSITYDYINRGRRQDKTPLYLENGSFYIFKPEILLNTNNRLGGNIVKYIMPMWKSFEIDSPEDIQICSTFMQRLLKN